MPGIAAEPHAGLIPAESVLHILTSGPRPLLVLDAALRVILANTAFCALFQIPEEKIQGRSIQDPAEADWNIPSLKLLLEDRIRNQALAADFEIHHTFAHLGPRILRFNFRRLATSADTGAVFVLEIEDVSRWRQAEEALQESETRFRTAVGIVSSLIWTNNAEGMMEGPQPGWGGFTGQTEEEYQGHGWADAVHPDDAQATIEAWRAAVADKRLFVFEHRVRRRDGEWRRCSVRAVPLLGEDWAIREWVGVHTDITERQRSEEALRASEESLRAYVKATSELVYRMNADWSMMGQLDGRNFLADADFPTGTWLDDYVYPEDQPRVRQAIEQAIRRKGTFELEHRVRRADGTAGWTYSKAVPVFDAQGDIVEWLGAAADITERKRAELNLVLLASISQDLAALTGVDEIMATVGAKIADHLQLSMCAFVEINEAADEAVVTHDWHRGDRPSIIGVYCLTDFFTDDFANAGRAGEVFVVGDTATDPRTTGDNFAKHGVRSLLSVPLIKDGQWRFYLCIYHSEPWNWQEDEIELVREITSRLWTRLEHLRSEKTVRESEERYRTLFESIDEGFCLIEMIYDAEGKAVDWLYLEVNPSFEEQTGLRKVAGRRVREFAPDHEEHWFETYGMVASTGEPVRFENEAKGIDGRWFDLYAFRIGGPGSRKVAVLFNNITIRKRAEEALRTSESFNRSIIESSPDCIKVLDLQGNLLSMQSGQALLGIEDIRPYLNKSWIDFWEGEYRLAAIAAVESAALTGEGKFRGFFQTLRGEPKWWDVAISPIQNAGGEICQLLAVSRDVTDRQHLEASLITRAEELARADRNKDEFLAMLAHELRNPLAPLRNASEILKTAAPGTEAHQLARGILTRQIENMSQMIDDLLDVSRITEGKIELRKQPVALEAVLQAAANLAQPGIEAKDQHFSLILPAEPVHLDGDATRLDQIFGNLLTNACKYSPPGCRISVIAERVPVVAGQPSEVIVKVRDNGTGIAPDLLPHIFDLFVQATRSLDRTSGGLGIGLTLVRRLVQLHGGSVEAFSGGLGHGSEFIVRLPILAHHDESPNHSPARPKEDISRRILIVDDNTDSAETMAMLQNLRGHETRTAYDGPQALIAAGEFLPEIMLLDIGLPGMDGYEIVRHLRAMPAMAGTFIVAISGYGSAEDVTRAREAGFDEHLVKPADLNILREWMMDRV